MEAIAESSSYSFRRLLRSPASNQRSNRIHNPVLLLNPYSNTRRRQGLGLRCSLPTTSISPSSSSTIGLVLDLGATDSWDSSEVGSPVVKRLVRDDEERWFMWYHGRQTTASNPHSSSIGLAISADGIHWERVETDGPGWVMSQSDNWWAFDTVGLTPSDVLVMSSDKVKTSGSVYWMYYTGISSDKPKNDNWIPYMVEMDGVDEWRLYYRGKGGDGRTGIGMAVSQGKGVSSGFRRWEGFTGQ